MRVALGVLLGLVLAAPAPWAQSGPVTVQRNLFFDQADRPARSLAGGGEISLAAERVDAGSPANLRLNSRSPNISAALRFRPLETPADGWALTVYLTTHHADRDFYYLSLGQRAVGGALVPQQDYRAEGLETALTAADEQGRMRSVREIVVQDDGQAEIRASLDGDTLRLVVVLPEDGGTPTPPRFAGGKGPDLRFLDYAALASLYTNNALGEVWVGGHFVLRGNYVSGSSESLAAVRAAIAQQLWRWERFSIWVEGGLGVLQKRNEKTNVTGDAKLDLAPGIAGHWRYKTFGATLHLGSAGGPLIAEVLGGWQFATNWGALVSWQRVKDSAGFGIGLSSNW